MTVFEIMYKNTQELAWLIDEYAQLHTISTLTQESYRRDIYTLLERFGWNVYKLGEFVRSRDCTNIFQSVVEKHWIVQLREVCNHIKDCLIAWKDENEDMLELHNMFEESLTELTTILKKHEI